MFEIPIGREYVKLCCKLIGWFLISHFPMNYRIIHEIEIINNYVTRPKYASSHVTRSTVHGNRSQKLIRASQQSTFKLKTCWPASKSLIVIGYERHYYSEKAIRASICKQRPFENLRLISLFKKVKFHIHFLPHYRQG